MTLGTGVLALGLGSLAAGCRCRRPAYMGVVLDFGAGPEIHEAYECRFCEGVDHWDGDEVARVCVWRINHTSGFGFDTIRTRGVRVVIYSSRLSPEQDRAVERKMVDRLRTDPSFARLGAYRPGQPLRRSVVWSGVLLNALTITLASALAYGLVTRKRRVTRLERLRANRCPICEYDLRGLPVPICPECGHDLHGNTPAPAEV